MGGWMVPVGISDDGWEAGELKENRMKWTMVSEAIAMIVMELIWYIGTKEERGPILLLMVRQGA